MGNRTYTLGTETPYDGVIKSQVYNPTDYPVVPSEQVEEEFRKLDDVFTRIIDVGRTRLGEEEGFELKTYVPVLYLGHSFVPNEKMYGDVVFKQIRDLTDEDINYLVNRSFELFEENPVLRGYSEKGTMKIYEKENKSYTTEEYVPQLNVEYDTHHNPDSVPSLIVHGVGRSNNGTFKSKNQLKEYFTRQRDNFKADGKKGTPYSSESRSFVQKAFFIPVKEGDKISASYQYTPVGSLLDKYEHFDFTVPSPSVMYNSESRVYVTKDGEFHLIPDKD